MNTDDRDKWKSEPRLFPLNITYLPFLGFRKWPFQRLIPDWRFANDCQRSHDIQRFLIRVTAAFKKAAIEFTSPGFSHSMPVTMDPDKSSAQLRYSPDFESEGFKQQVESHKLSLCGRKLTWAIAFVTGTGFTLFGCASDDKRVHWVWKHWSHWVIDMIKVSCLPCWRPIRQVSVYQLGRVIQFYLRDVLSSRRRFRRWRWVPYIQIMRRCRVFWLQYT